MMSLLITCATCDDHDDGVGKEMAYTLAGHVSRKTNHDFYEMIHEDHENE